MNSIEKMNRRRFWIALISAIVVFVCTCIALVINLTNTEPEAGFDNMGLKTFKMFTVNSNIFCGFTFALFIPYAIDGLRKHNYHMPNWIVNVLHCSLTCVFMTFIISLCVLSPVRGFVPIMLDSSRLFLHTICPILAFVAFGFCITDHRIKFKESFLAIIPVAVYAIVYLIMVVVIGEENGGWEDIYGFATRIPLWVSCVAVLPIAYGCGAVPMAFHNGSYKRRKMKEIKFYQDDFSDLDLSKAVVKMADYDNDTNKTGDIIIPRRTIEFMAKYSNKKWNIDDLCHLYLTAYLDERLIGNKEKGEKEYDKL